MKTIQLILLAILIAACSKNDPTPDKMSGVWKVKSISRDNIDYTLVYAKTRFTFSTSGYSITNRPDLTPFQPSGTLNQSLKNFKQTDGLSFDYVSISDTEITFHFTFNGTGYVGGRVSEVVGQWSVDLIKI